jgi:hypothetical protein
MYYASNFFQPNPFFFPSSSSLPLIVRTGAHPSVVHFPSSSIFAELLMVAIVDYHVYN